MKKRILYLDILKVIALLFMAVIHTFAFVSAFELYSSDFPLEHLSTQMSILYIITPSIFMFSMGATLFKTTKDYKTLIKRGLHLLLLGLILNLLRGSLLYIILAVFEDMEYILESWYWIWGSDILYFAGIYFIVMGLLKKFKLKDIYILLVFTIMFILSNIITIEVPNYTLSMIVGNIFYVDPDSYFPIFTWGIFPTLGYMFQKYYDKSKDKDEYMLKILLTSIIILLVAINLMSNFIGFEERYLLWGEGDFIMDLPTIIFTLSIDYIYIVFIYFISKLFEIESINNLITKISSNLTNIYFVHWLIVMYGGLLFYLLLPFKVSSGFGIYLIGFIVVLISTIIVFMRRKHEKTKKII